MKFLALTVFATVVLALIPVPGQASYDPTSATGDADTKPKKADKGGADKQAPIKPLQEPIGANAQQGVADTKDKEQAVRVRELPAVTITPASKGWLDYAPVALSGLLVILGFFQWWLLKRQSEIMASQQRAYLAVSATSRSGALIAGVIPEIEVSMKNVGQTPAYEMTADGWLEFLQEPFVNFSEKSRTKGEYGVTLHPKDPLPINFQMKLGRALDEGDVSRIAREGYQLCFRVLIKYRDASGKTRFQGFAQFLNANGRTFAYLPKYNDSN